MAKRMLIDASHLEETRVVVLNGSRLEDFDYESASKKQLKGNIYLAKITRVEPSLQAAFVDYGGNRHGFLPFSEIHPDYYQIPVADREALLAEEAALKAETVEEDFLADVDDDESPDEMGREITAELEAELTAEGEEENGENGENGDNGEAVNAEAKTVAVEAGVDTVGGDEVEDAARKRSRLLRKYKIQEVIKRRQVILVQVTKEERGNKGAALTAYLSLAGRYCVLMPNTAKGGGISRKISNATDRRRLKGILEDLDIPEGVAVIVRTAGSERTKAEIRRDYEYLLRLWSEIRDTTLASTAPNLIYEEANLIKRSIRDLYQSNMDEILVEGDEGHKAAKAFMKSLMPSHAKKVTAYKDPVTPLFNHYQVESQIDAMHNATVQLKSGGYIVMNMTEALVAIDVNSGKATRGRHIEETAYKTNLEAAEEVPRQLRLRDLAGLIVIDFIDMEESRHNRGVERKLKEAMRQDRARIQLGRISPFGLLEMSRQRLRPSLFESSTEVCPHCNASGYVRTTQSVAMHILRGLEEEGIRRGAGEVTLAAPTNVALHILNQMRDRLVSIEQRYGFRVQIVGDDSIVSPDYRLERPGWRSDEAGERRGEATTERSERKRSRTRRRRKRDEDQPAEVEHEAAEDEIEEVAAEAAEATEETADDKPKRRRRRGKRGGRRRSRQRKADTAETEAGIEEPAEPAAEEPAAEQAEPAEAKPRRRRSRGPRRKKAAAEARPEPAGASEPASETESEPTGDTEVEPEAEAKPKRRRRSVGSAKRTAQKKAAQKAAEPAGEPVPEAQPVAIEPPSANDGPAAPANNGEDPGGAVVEPSDAGEDKGSSKRGWWERWG